MRNGAGGRPAAMGTGTVASGAVVFLLVSGCAQASRSAPSPSPAAMAVAQSPAGSPDAVPSTDRAMRITVETTVVVAHRDAAVAALRAAVVAAHGYVGEGTVTGGDVGGSASFTVKVPVPALADFRARLAGLGEVTRDGEKAEDVTEARADVKARLRNARAEDQRLLDLLANRTGNLGDVVLVEKELANVRETIERFEAEERTMEGQIAYATVKVELSTVWVPSPETPGHHLAQAAKDGVTTAKDFVFGLVTLTLSAGPTLLILALMAYGLFLVVRRWRRQRTRAA